MASRLDLQQELEEFMEGGLVKFQPPPSYQLTYPCIVYDYTGGRTEFSDNKPYMYTPRYTITIITREASMDLPTRFAMRFPMCVHDRSFKTDNLRHHIFTLYY